MSTPTPETDAKVKELLGYFDLNAHDRFELMSDFAKFLETRLAAAEKERDTLKAHVAELEAQVRRAENDSLALLGKLDSSRAENAKANAEIEILAWNLAGCSTYAKGCDLTTGHNKEMARPALNDVLEMALRESALKARVEELENALADRNKQLGVACLKHDLTHSLTCGQCHAEDKRKLAAYEAPVDEEELRAALEYLELPWIDNADFSRLSVEEQKRRDDICARAEAFFQRNETKARHILARAYRQQAVQIQDLKKQHAETLRGHYSFRGEVADAAYGKPWGNGKTEVEIIGTIRRLSENYESQQADYHKALEQLAQFEGAEEVCTSDGEVQVVHPSSDWSGKQVSKGSRVFIVPPKPAQQSAEEIVELWYTDQMSGKDCFLQKGKRSEMEAIRDRRIDRGSDCWIKEPVPPKPGAEGEASS